MTIEEQTPEAGSPRAARALREEECAVEVASFLRAALTRSNRKQSDLADALNLHKSQITLMLQGKRSISLAEYRAICKFFGRPDVGGAAVPIRDTILQAGHWREMSLKGRDTFGEVAFPLTNTNTSAATQSAYRLKARLGPLTDGDLLYCAPMLDEPRRGDICVALVTQPPSLYCIKLRYFRILRTGGAGANRRAQELQNGRKISVEDEVLASGWYDLENHQELALYEMGETMGLMLGFVRNLERG